MRPAEMTSPTHPLLCAAQAGVTYYIVVDGYTGGDWLDSEVRWLDSQVGCIRVCSGHQPWPCPVAAHAAANALQLGNCYQPAGLTASPVHPRDCRASTP